MRYVRIVNNSNRHRSNRSNKSGKISVLKLGAIALASVICVGYLSAKSANNSVIPTDIKPQSIQVDHIVLDAGHGGMDGGAVGIDGTIEKDINLNITLALKEMLELSGLNVVLTRDADVSIHDKDVEGIANQKKSDIRNRLAIIDELDNSIAISIHQNKFTEPSSKGAQIFYGRNNDLSIVLANAMQENIVTRLQPDNTRELKEGTSSVYLLNNAKAPMVLVECGFLSNPDEVKLLKDEEYQQKLAFCIYCGILDYITV